MFRSIKKMPFVHRTPYSFSYNYIYRNGSSNIQQFARTLHRSSVYNTEETIHKDAASAHRPKRTSMIQ